MIKMLGKIAGLVIGSSLSPSWALLTLVLKDYFDLKAAMVSPQQFIVEYTHFLTMAQAHPEFMLQSLFPSMIAISLFGILFVTCISHLCGRLACILAARLQMKSIPSVSS